MRARDRMLMMKPCVARGGVACPSGRCGGRRARVAGRTMGRGRTGGKGRAWGACAEGVGVGGGLRGERVGVVQWASDFGGDQLGPSEWWPEGEDAGDEERGQGAREDAGEGAGGGMGEGVDELWVELEEMRRRSGGDGNGAATPAATAAPVPIFDEAAYVEWWKSLEIVYMVVFEGSGAEQGVYSLQTLRPNDTPLDTVIAFESEDDALGFCVQLEAVRETDGLPLPQTEAVEPEELLSFCELGGFAVKVIPASVVFVPPQRNVPMTDWERATRLRGMGTLDNLPMTLEGEDIDESDRFN